MAIDNSYPNTHYALSIIAEKEGDLHSAFFSAIEAVKVNKNKDNLSRNSLKQALEIAQEIIKTGIGKPIVRQYLRKLEDLGEKEIQIVEDEKIPTAAKIEFAENHNRPHHLIRYKSKHLAVEHLQLHELVHLQFALDARKEKINQLFVSTQVQKATFIKALEQTIKGFKKNGFDEKSIASYCLFLFDGINQQIFNTPIDLFIEDFIYNEYVEMRPYQLISLYSLIEEGRNAVTNKKIVELSPKEILSKSKIYNLVSAFHFKLLYGVDMTKDFQATSSELKQAQEFIDEYIQYRNDKEPGEEYELVSHWAEDLKLKNNFELVDENEYRNKTTNLENLLETIERDPFDLESKNPEKVKAMETFQTSQKEIGLNMAIVMFMVDALKFFQHMDIAKIREIASQIAMQGTQGFSPNEDGYRIPAIDNKEFSGYHILAYYYISWKLSMPEMLSQLRLPYDKEYQMALTLLPSDG